MNIRCPGQGSRFNKLKTLPAVLSWFYGSLVHSVSVGGKAGGAGVQRQMTASVRILKSVQL